MGTTLSVSSRDPPCKVDKHKSRSLNKPRLIVSAFGFKLVKQKSGKKVNPHPQTLQINESSQNEENQTPCFHELERSKLPANKRVTRSPVQIVLQADTGELLLCLARFLRRCCVKTCDLTSDEVIAWIRDVDRTLLMQGWQEEGFISPPVLVFVYLLCRNTVDQDITSSRELHGVVLTCLYLTYSYLGTEISYPLQPFIIDTNKDVFWQQVLSLIDKLSSEMLRINMDHRFFTEVFHQLKNEGESNGPDP